jgi:hypothetical protein
VSSFRFRTPLPLLASLAVILAAGVTGCGATAHHGAATSRGAGQGGSSSVPAEDVAVVDGTPITGTSFGHWLQVMIYSNATQSGGVPVVPDPPDFTHCIGEARTIVKVAHETSQKLKTDCEALLASDTGQTMDFLIKNVWLERAAAHAHLEPSAAEVQETFTAQKEKEFKSTATFNTFLAATKQTTTDIMLRIRINQILTALAKRAGGVKALETELLFTYRPKTHCAAGYAISDCAGSSATSTG